jgi:hypothetical protein
MQLLVCRGAVCANVWRNIQGEGRFNVMQEARKVRRSFFKISKLCVCALMLVMHG